MPFPVINPHFQFFDNVGEPLANGFVYTYESTSATPKTTYQDADLDSANTNPIELNSAGRCSIYVDEGETFKYILKDADGVTLDTQDKVKSPIGTQAGIGAALYPQAAAELAAGVTPASYIYPPGDVRRYMVDGATDDTTAFTTAISVAQEMTNGGFVHVPAGSYTVSSTLATSGDRIHIRGDGRSATRIVFAPTASDVLFEFHNGSSAIVRCSLKGMSIYSNDSTFTKTAIDLYDTEEFELEDVEIGGSIAVSSVAYWSGSNSIGLRTRGRQCFASKNVSISADRPVVISVNPNSTIDIDHFNFNNQYLIANGHPVVEIETGVELTNVSFDGYQAWVKGTHGLYWLDTTSTGQSAMLKLENVRWEQGTHAGDYLVRIEHNTALTGVKLINCRGGGDAIGRNGYYFRKVNNVLWDTTLYEGTGVALDADATCRALKGVNTFWQTASTSTLAGQKLIYGSPVNPSGGLRPNFEYDTTANADETLVTEAALCGIVVSIAQDATHTIGTTALQGFLLVTTDENTSAIYALRGSTATTAEVSDPDGFFTNAAGGATAYNIYATGGNYVIQNKRTGTHEVRYLLIGAHSVA